MGSFDGLVFAYQLDGKGGGKAIDWQSIRAWAPGDPLIWVHLDLTQVNVQQWLMKESGLDPVVAEALLIEDSRPRFLNLDPGVILILRGVNLNPGANPEDMVSVRMWIEPTRIITMRGRRVMAVARP